MKIRESGMPDEATWNGFFDPGTIIAQMGIKGLDGDIAEFGCGYGTFTLAAARVIHGCVHALDLEAEMVETTQTGALAAGLENVQTRLRDFIQAGTGLGDAVVAYVMLFNILHGECPEILLQEAHRILTPGGHLGVIHWKYDPATPRGPPMQIRPTPQQCIAWAESVGFRLEKPGIIDLPPYHYGLRFTKA